MEVEEICPRSVLGLDLLTTALRGCVVACFLKLADGAIRTCRVSVLRASRCLKRSYFCPLTVVASSARQPPGTAMSS
jgi:hypothetical protein